MLFNAWHCSVWLMAAFKLQASCSILHCPRRCNACNGICVCLFLVCSVVLACFTLLMLSSLLALAPGDLLLVSPSSRCSHRRLCVYIVQPSRLAACRSACAQCRAWHETPRAAFAKQSKLDPLDEAAGLDGAGEQVAHGVVVPDPEGNLDALAVDEVHPTRQRDSGHAAGGGRKGGKRRWKILDVAPRLYIIDVGRRELVVQALHQFIVHRLGDVLHRAWLSPIAVRQVRGQSSADGTRAPRPGARSRCGSGG